MTGIIHILSDMTLTGAPAVVLSLVKGLDKKEFSSIVIGPPGPMVQEFEDQKISVYPLVYGSKFSFAVIGQLHKQIKQAVQQLKADKVIIHCHGPRAGLFGRLAARSFPYPVIYTEHTWTKDYHLPNPINSWAQVTILRYLDRYATKTVGVSQAVTDWLIGNKISRFDKTILIYNGIELPAQPQPLNDGLVLGSVGSLSWQKNYGWLIQVMNRVVELLPDAQLEIVGSGSDKMTRQLQGQIDELNLSEHVRLLGSLSKEQLSDRYGQWALYIQPSTNESFGLAAAEAVAAGLPAIASNVGSLSEILGTKNALFDLNNQEEAANKIIELLKNNKKRAELRDSELAHIQRFSIEKMIAGYQDLYQQV